MAHDVPALAVEALDWLRGEAGPLWLPSNGALAPPLMSHLSSWPQDLGGGSGFLAAWDVCAQEKQRKGHRLQNVACVGSG